MDGSGKSDKIKKGNMMKRILMAATLALTPASAIAQSSDMMTNGTGSMGTMGNMGSMMMPSGTTPATEPGQGAFAAIAEIVAALQADPNTDWSLVSIDTLREHLRDMDVVTIDAKVVTDDIDGGLRFTITGTPEVFPSIQRMALGHAAFMQGVNGWQYEAVKQDAGAEMTIIVPEADLSQLKGLGFFGMLASGMHHQPHHWAMASGQMPGG
jgi:hypothetical protein